MAVQTFDTTLNSSDLILSQEFHPDWQKRSLRLCQKDHRLSLFSRYTILKEDIKPTKSKEKSRVLLKSKHSLSKKRTSKKDNALTVPNRSGEEIKILVTNDQGIISTQPVP